MVQIWSHFNINVQCHFLLLEVRVDTVLESHSVVAELDDRFMNFNVLWCAGHTKSVVQVFDYCSFYKKLS